MVTVVLGTALFSCGDEEDTHRGHSATDSGTRRMAEHLEEIAETVNPLTNPYANAERVVYFREELERLKETTPPFGNRKGIVKARFDLANELLLDGKSEEAAQELELLQEEVDQVGVLHRIQILTGLAYLRLGEQENCVANHTIDSCLMPIEGAGIHEIVRGSRGAIGQFEKVLARNPDDLSARWLLNIAYMTLGDYPDNVPEGYLVPPSVFESDYDIKRFRDVAPSLGIDVIGLSGGGIMEDLNGDGYYDIMASSWGLRDQVRYFRNASDGRFVDETEAAGLTGIVGGLNANTTDYDNNGTIDVLILRGAWLNRPPATDGGRHPNSLLRNEAGSFADATESSGLLSFHPTQTATWGDYDSDGWVDLYIGNESFGKERHPNQLYRNLSDGTFEEVATKVNAAVEGYVKGVIWGDYDNDGDLDLYLSRLKPDESNLLLRNEKGGQRFADVTVAAGVPGPPNSFPTWFWDYDNDGWLDIFASGYLAGASEVAADYMGLPHDGEPAKLYRNRGDGTFDDITEDAGLDRALLTMGSNFGDLDNDGYLDCYLGTGSPGLTSLMPNRMFRNDGGRRFQDVTTSGGFGTIQKGHGVAFGDIDHDGDQEVYASMGGAYAGDVYQNILFENPGHGNRWIKLKLEGVQSNRAAIGARIKVAVHTQAGLRDVYATVTSGGSFGAASFQQEIGLGQATSIEAIKIRWPATKKVQVFEDVQMDRSYRIVEGDPVPRVVDRSSFDLSPALDLGAHGDHD